MNFKMVLKSLGILLISEAFLMVPSLAAAVYYRGSDILSFIYSILIILIIGMPLALIKPTSRKIYAKDGFAIVGFGWILYSFFGAMPFYISGTIPSYIDAFFEAISGFTTTGASILTEVESLPRGILFWRSFTHWIGGMGILVLTLAILPAAGARTFHIMKAESPGPTPGKLVPKIGQTAKILYGLYFVMTVVLILLLIAAGMPVYDSMVHAFGTAGTGGFSIKNTSIGAYNNVYIEIILGVFMLIFGANLALYYQLFKGNPKALYKDDEFRFYIGVVSVAVILVTLNIYGNMFDSFWQSLRHAFFQVSSIITTTGYASTDFNKWPVFSKAILLTLMLIGGCAGSTAGAIKNIRILLLLKTIKKELMKIIHPRSVFSVKTGGKVVEDEVLSGVMAFFFTYMLIFGVAVLALTFEGHDFEVAISAVATTIGNVGPGFGIVGPMGNFSVMSDASTILLSICMLIGRLEIFPILLLFVPSFWKRVNI
ncbi:MAG: potassium transporter KefA [Clostridiales bacterium]|jgi:trk system potassium uptake protein TrkH|nr:potassium transporter KefA [Clostridiales bacterium]